MTSLHAPTPIPAPVVTSVEVARAAFAPLPAAAIALSGLGKTYAPRGPGAEVRALDGIDLTIPRGCIYGLLGPNGAGKSTLINILAGLVNKTSGTARIWGADVTEEPRRARLAIGIVPQELNIDPFFTPAESLELQAGLYGVPKSERRTGEILAAVGLSDKANAYARTLSGGMRRRLMVAKALVHNPPILVLDEPTAGVDVDLRRQLWTYVRELNAAGRTILLTTHYLEEAQALCERIAIIDRGRLVAEDTTPALLRRLDAKLVRIALVQPPAPGTVLPDALRAIGVELADDGRLVFRYQPSRTRLSDLFAIVAAEGLTIEDVSTEESDLEDIFLQLTRHEEP